MTFFVGQKVVCIADHWSTARRRDRDLLHLPRKGEVYVIRAVVQSGDDIGLRLHWLINQAFDYDDGFGEAAFNSRCFRPIVERPTDISVFTKLLNPAPSRDLVS